MSKPLPLEEVSPKVTERASSVPKNICTAISISFCKSDAIAVFFKNGAAIEAGNKFELSMKDFKVGDTDYVMVVVTCKAVVAQG